MSPAVNPTLVQLDELLQDLERLLGESEPDPRQLGMLRIALSGWTRGASGNHQA